MKVWQLVQWKERVQDEKGQFPKTYDDGDGDDNGDGGGVVVVVTMVIMFVVMVVMKIVAMMKMPSRKMQMWGRPP